MKDKLASTDTNKKILLISVLIKNKEMADGRDNYLKIKSAYIKRIRRGNRRR
jgi:hypothetical protein